MAKKKLSEEQKKEIELLRANNQMYADTIQQAKERGSSDATIKRIQIAKDDVEKKLMELGEDPQSMAKDDDIEYIMYSDVKADDVNIFRPDEIEDEKQEFVIEEETKAEVPVEVVNDNSVADEVVEARPDTFADEGSENVQYDVIPLPSNGECYPNKLSRVPVGYLTAYDENMIMSPNLYRDGLILEYLLKNKVLNKDINVDNLVRGDVDAITLFLRATSYGTDFPISVTDPKTGERVDTVLDLSTLKTKEFKLKGDENGYFDFTLPKTKAQIKFRYLTLKDEKTLEKISRVESEELRAEELRNVSETIESALKIDKTLSAKDKQIIRDYNKQLEVWINELKKKNTVQFTRAITNRMEMQIVAVNGKKDRKYIHQAVMRMPAQDALALRKYMLDNEPGIDFNIKVDRPEGLGGGSIDTFLEWSETVFLNLA